MGMQMDIWEGFLEGIRLALWRIHIFEAAS